MPQDIKETIWFKRIHHEQVNEKQQAALRVKFKENLAKQNAESKKRSTMYETSAAEEQQNRAKSILEHQTEYEIERIGCRKKISEIQQQQAITKLKEVKCSDSVKVQSTCRRHVCCREHSLKTEDKTHGTNMR